MNFLRLHDPLIRLLFEDDDIIAVDKPYGFNTHTNESKAGNADTVEHGLIEIFERQLGRALHIVHRLDRTTTGVVIFAKSQESAKKYSEFFFSRRVSKTYQFVTASRSAQTAFEIDKDILQKGKELAAKTRFIILKKSEGFELWQANPLTGRNHQIRIHAAAGGIPLLGDEKYGGNDYPFLCLHNRRIEFPNGIVIEAKEPEFFTNLSLLSDSKRANILHEADRRLRLFRDADKDQCYRLMHKDLVIDRFGRKEVFNDDAGVRVSDDSIEPWIAKEESVKYELQITGSASVGLYSDQRLHRRWLKEFASGKSVLNLFSSTCGYGLSAALGGASQVVSVEQSKSALLRGKRNFELNGLDPAKYKFSAGDSLAYLEVCLKKEIKFDVLICHAPAFHRGEKKKFSLAKDIESLLAACLKCLNLEGRLLFLTNSNEVFIADIRRSIEKVGKDLKLKALIVDCILPALDFELVGETPRLKSFLLKI
jgi:23S rRNA (cytosine1962-C5)-methyltransferase